MPQTFAYKVRDKSGQARRGYPRGREREARRAALREMGYVPIEIGKEKKGLNLEISISDQKVKLKDVAVFSRQFATMINSGLSMLRSLYILAEQTESKPLAADRQPGRASTSSRARRSPRRSRSTRRRSTASTSRWCTSGETGGVLDSVLLRLAATIEKQVELRRKVKSAMTYPVVGRRPRRC